MLLFRYFEENVGQYEICTWCTVSYRQWLPRNVKFIIRIIFIIVWHCMHNIALVSIELLVTQIRPNSSEEYTYYWVPKWGNDADAQKYYRRLKARTILILRKALQRSTPQIVVLTSTPTAAHYKIKTTYIIWNIYLLTVCLFLKQSGAHAFTCKALFLRHEAYRASHCTQPIRNTAFINHSRPELYLNNTWKFGS